MTTSELIGELDPGAPPDEFDQFVVDVLSQVPDPPTQYLFAEFPLKHINEINMNSSIIVLCIV
jgi:hypothetical protein